MAKLEKSQAGCTCMDQMRKNWIAESKGKKREIVGVMYKVLLHNINDLSGAPSTGQPIVVREKIKNKKNEEKVVNINTFVAHNYCPWCDSAYAFIKHLPKSMAKEFLIRSAINAGTHF